MFSAYHEYGKNPMALSCRPSGFYGPYTMDRNTYIEIQSTQAACKPIFQKINTLCEKASIEVQGKHFDLDILMGGDIIKFLNSLSHIRRRR
jgi:hypothetical protein